MLPLPQQRSEDRACSHGAGRPTERHHPTSGGGPKHVRRSYGKRQEGIGDCGGNDKGGGRGYDGTLPSEKTTMGKKTPDMEHGEEGKGGKVSDGLSPGD